MQDNNETSRVVRQFRTAFRERDPSLIPDLVGECVTAYLDNVKVWQAMVVDTGGVTLLRVESGKIVEAFAYGKTSSILPDVATADVIRRFNDVFQRHDPGALQALVAADCVIENTTPAPDGARYVGRDACVGLWSRIATSAGMHFEIEDVVVAGERATIRWRLVWGKREADSVRGVNLMRVKNGQITEALGYVKGASES